MANVNGYSDYDGLGLAELVRKGEVTPAELLEDALAGIDAVNGALNGVTGSAPLYYMVNCAHPTHFADVLRDDGAWLERIKVIRANASRMSHEELDEAEELDRGDVDELAADYVSLRDLLPDLRVVGGCCGTDHEHVAAISRALGGR